MNYHLMIDHWFTNEFIENAEKVCPGGNTYIVDGLHPFKHIKYANALPVSFESQEINNIVQGIGIGDKVFIHWFHKPVNSFINRLQTGVPVYLIFWGGDFLGEREFVDFNFDKLTKKYLGYQDKPKGIYRFLVNVVKYIKGTERNGEKASNQWIEDRREFMSRLNYFCHWNLADMEIVKRVYGGNPKFLYFFYGAGLGDIPECEPRIKIDGERINIFLGNSDTPSNNHLDAIEKLAKFKNDNIFITCPLNYGFQKEYGDMISKTGKDVFGIRWSSLRDFMPIDKYLQLQANVDVVVMYHNRTQASGNILAFIVMGKKVYLKGQSTLYALLKENGVIVFDANSIDEISFSEFSQPLTSEEILRNRTNIKNLFSLKKQRECYVNILLGR